MYQFPWTVRTDYQKLVGLNQEKLILSKFWRPEIWRQSVLRAAFVLMSQGRIPLASAWFLLVASILALLDLRLHHCKFSLSFHVASFLCMCPAFYVFKDSSVQFSFSVVFDSLWPHGLQHCPSPTPGVYSNLCPSSQWCHPPISSSVAPFSSCLQSVPSSESAPMSQFFASSSLSSETSASASVLPMNIQEWFPLGLTGF